ncbi:MAG TPA: hydantoinase/oxoprolinase family protein [Solirubrobacterales bacterium]
MSPTSDESSAQYILGVDVGGTFTDAILIDTQSGELRRAKVATTPEDQSEGVLATFGELGIAGGDLDVFCHGTTVGLNALLQRRGASVGLICTEGTRDLLDTGRLTRNPRDGLYDAAWKRPQQDRPLVHRRHIREVPGRILYDGTVHVELDEDAVRRELEFLREEGVDAIGVCLMNSYVDLDHERRVLALVEEILPEAYVQSSSFRPVVGEYTRTAGVVIDAYTGGVVSRYMNRLEDQLRSAGFDGPAVIMQVNGGVRTLRRTVESFPAYTLESGPVAGMLGAEHYGTNFLDARNLVCIDIGGTSTDLGLVVDGSAQGVDDWEVEWALPLGVPAIDVRSIGAGGGSLIQTDEMGTLRVGPESAGAVPGPVSYGRGGEVPTVTDAHIALGAMRPERFLGGRMDLDVEAAAAAIGRLAEQLEMDPRQLAIEAVHLMNANIEAEVSRMVFERGVDIQGFALFAFGGAGALHAVEVARMAGIEEVIVPQVAGGFSAMGMVTAPPKVEAALSSVTDFAALDLAETTKLFDDLQQSVEDDLVAQGVEREEIEIERSFYGMYNGQSFSNELALGDWPLDAGALERWKSSFDELYDRLYGYSAPEIGVTITTLRVVGTGRQRELTLPTLEDGGREPPVAALAGTHPLYLRDGRSVEAPFYLRSELLSGNRIAGPAVIEDEVTTMVVPADAEAAVDSYGNVRITLK